MQCFARVCAFTLALIASFVTYAQPPLPFPTKVVHIIVPAAAGGTTDITARLLAPKLSQLWQQGVVVENRPGANGIVAARAILAAPPDGYSLLMGTSSHAVGATLFPDPGYSLTKDFRAVHLAADATMVLVANLQVPPNTVRDLVTYSKAGNKMYFGSGGSGTLGHLAGEQFNTLINSDMKHVPYKGAGALIGDLIGNQVQLYFANLPEVAAQIKSKRLKALAVTGAQRAPEFPDVPTFKEAGYGAIDARSWFGLFAPSATPEVVYEHLANSIAKVLAEPSTVTDMRATGAEPGRLKGEAFQKFVESEVVKWGALVKVYRAKPD